MDGKVFFKASYNKAKALLYEFGEAKNNTDQDEMLILELNHLSPL